MNWLQNQLHLFTILPPLVGCLVTWGCGDHWDLGLDQILKVSIMKFSFLLEFCFGFGIVKRMFGELGLVLELFKQCLKIWFWNWNCLCDV